MTAGPGEETHRVPGSATALHFPKDSRTSATALPAGPLRGPSAVGATSTVGLASGPPGGRRTASALNRATPTVCHTRHAGGQSSGKAYPAGDGGQTRGHAEPPPAGPLASRVLPPVPRAHRDPAPRAPVRRVPVRSVPVRRVPVRRVISPRNVREKEPPPSPTPPPRPVAATHVSPAPPLTHAGEHPGLSWISGPPAPLLSAPAGTTTADMRRPPPGRQSQWRGPDHRGRRTLPDGHPKP